MSTRIIRQFIKQFSPDYIDYVNMMTNFDADMEQGVLQSDKAPYKIELKYQGIDFTIILQDRCVKEVLYSSPNKGTGHIMCSFRPSSFIEAFDVLIIMLLLPHRNKKQSA